MKLNRACIADPSHSPPLLSDRLLACLSIQLRALPCSVPSISIRNTPNLPLLTESGLNDPRHSAPSLPHLAVAIRTRPHLNAPRLPDLYFPYIDLLLAVLTHLACHASSTCPCQSPPHRSSPSSPYLPIRITRCLPPQTLPDPNAPRQSAFAIPCLLLLAYPSFPDPSFSYAVLPDLLIRAFLNPTLPFQSVAIAVKPRHAMPAIYI